jgi:alkylation response protein AidB-like acyl-CoA dehydrogenase
VVSRERRFPPSPKSPTRGGFDRAFSHELGERGWAGMLVPARFGGAEATGVERCLVISEMLTDWAQATAASGAVGLEAAATAKTLSGYAADWVGRTAHQVHGAMGVTIEYPLHRFTRRIWDWAIRDGATELWSARLGRVATTTEGGAWRIITTI